MITQFINYFNHRSVRKKTVENSSLQKTWSYVEMNKTSDKMKFITTDRRREDLEAYMSFWSCTSNFVLVQRDMTCRSFHFAWSDSFTKDHRKKGYNLFLSVMQVALIKNPPLICHWNYSEGTFEREGLISFLHFLSPSFGCGCQWLPPILPGLKERRVRKCRSCRIFCENCSTSVKTSGELWFFDF